MGLLVTKLTRFSCVAAINNGMLDALAAANMKALDGADAKAEILEDIKALSKTYSPGAPFTFTATLRAMVKPAALEEGVAEDASGALDVDASVEPA